MTSVNWFVNIWDIWSCIMVFTRTR